MNNLIEIQVNENQEQTISGRELHMFWEQTQNIMIGFNVCCNTALKMGRISTYSKRASSNRREREVRREIADHIMKLDMAKELCMLTRNEKVNKQGTTSLKLSATGTVLKR